MCNIGVLTCFYYHCKKLCRVTLFRDYPIKIIETRFLIWDSLVILDQKYSWEQFKFAWGIQLGCLRRRQFRSGRNIDSTTQLFRKLWPNVFYANKLHKTVSCRNRAVFIILTIGEEKILVKFIIFDFLGRFLFGSSLVRQDGFKWISRSVSIVRWS